MPLLIPLANRLWRKVGITELRGCFGRCDRDDTRDMTAFVHGPVGWVLLYEVGGFEAPASVRRPH
jgi:hypothetical protein